MRLLNFLEYVLVRASDLQPGCLGSSSASVYSDNSKPQEHYINLLLAKTFSQLPLLPCVFVIFCHWDRRLFWAVCLKVLFWALQRKVQNALTYWDWSVLQSTNFIYAFCAPHSAQLAGRFPSIHSILSRLNWFGISHSHRSGPLHILINCN